MILKADTLQPRYDILRNENITCCEFTHVVNMSVLYAYTCTL